MVEYINIIADCCKRVLNLKEARLSNSYFYRSLTLCIIDAVFSIRAKYETTMNTVERYCNYFDLKRYRTNRQSLPEIYEQQSVSDFLRSISEHADFLAGNVFKNRQRTSARNGILKSEAVLRFASVLKNYDVNYFQDIHKILSSNSFEKAIKAIPGQRSGISLKYFFMLAGSDDLIKPDMHIINFLKEAFQKKGIDRPISLEDAQVLLSGASDILRIEYTHLSPRLLDNTLWSYQRKQKKPDHAYGKGMPVIQNLNYTKRMPDKGDIFKGKVVDLCQHDTQGFRRRDIWFYKHDVNFRRRYEYPSRDHRIVLIDTEGHRYELNFSKPEYDDKICLGTPGRLKPWYQRKGFSDGQVNPDTWIFFEYTGVENGFHIFTQNERDRFLKKISEEHAMKTLPTWAGRSQFKYSGSVSQGTKITFGSGFSVTIKADQYSDLLSHFKGKTVDIGTIFTNPPRGSLGEWLQQNVTKTAIASYIGPILIYEKYAVKIGGSQIKFI